MTARNRKLAVVVVVMMALSAVAPAVAAGGSGSEPAERLAGDQPRSIDTATIDSSRTESDYAPSERSTRSDGTAVIGDGLRNATGTVEVVVRLAEAETAFATSAVATRSRLKDQAEQTQGAVRDFASARAGVEVLNSFWLTNAVLLEVNVDRLGERGLQELAALRGVTDVHENFQVSLPEPVEPAGDRGSGEPSVAESTDVEAANSYNTTYGLDQINATEVWDGYDTMGGGVKVAVLDTGVSIDHSDIDLYTEDASDPTYPGGWAEFDGQGERVEGSQPHADGYHGTHTSGTVAGGNASGTWIGVAPNVSLMHGQVIPGGGGSFAQIVAGMEWAVSEDADVVSMSLGPEGGGFVPALIEPVRNAFAAGTVVVASAGNAGPGTSGSPGNVYETFAVGASNENLGIGSFSSGEVVDTSAAWADSAPSDWPDEYVVPDVAAPGVDVLSAVPAGTFPNAPNSTYGYADGTSMAAPHVAGAMALLLSAAESDPSPERLEEVFAASGFKPADCEPSCDPRHGNDTRYGDGIIDAKVATDLVVADQGVEGTVRAPDGTPVSGVTVALNGRYRTTTAADGTFQLRAPAGTYRLTAANGTFGYSLAPRTVTVTDGNFSTLDLALEEVLGVQPVAGQPDRSESGSAFTVTADVANLDELTVEASGDYDASRATLRVNGEVADFGTPVAFDDYSGTVEVTVEPAAGTSGAISLSQTFAGAGDTATVQTGPTLVVADYVEVGIVDAPDGAHGDDLVSALQGPDGPLPVAYNLSMVRTPNLLDSLGDYEVYVVQSFGKYGQNLDRVREFVNATDGPDVGVVYLDQWALSSEGIPALSKATGNPSSTFEGGYIYRESDHPVTYDVTTDHPIVAGVAEAGETVRVHDEFRHDYTGFRGFSGTTIAQVGNNSTTFGPALAADGLSRTVLAGSLGRSTRIRNFDYTGAADRILANAITYADSSPPVVLGEGQPTRVDTGEPMNVSFEVRRLDEFQVDVADSSTVSTDDLSLYVEGKVAAFDQALAYDNRTDENFTVRVVPDGDVVGELSLDLTFVGGGADETVRTVTGPTAIYDPPLVVGDDVDTIADGIDLAPFDQNVTVYVQNGTYHEPVVLDKGGLTLRPVEGANVTLAPGADDEPALLMTASGVRAEGLAIDAAGGVGLRVYGAHNVTASGISVTDASRGVYVSDAPTRRASTSTDDVVLTGVSVTDADTGAFFTDNTFTPVGEYTLRNATIEARTMGVHARSAASTVEDSTIRGAPTGVQVIFADGVTVRNNTVRGADTAFNVLAFADDTTVRNNLVLNATTGFNAFAGVSGPLVGNEFHADTGINLAGTGMTVRGNDLANTSTAIASPGGRDVTLNYFGARGPADTTLPEGANYDPYLTRDPQTFDWSLASLSETTYVGTDVELPGSQPRALGVPGPGVGTVLDVLGEDFEGVAYTYEPASNRWALAHGDDELSSLDALLVVPRNGARAAFEFRVEGPAVPNQHAVERGLNFLAAPESAPVETAFGVGTADFVAALDLYPGPVAGLAPPGALDGRHQFAGPGDGPLVDPFAGNFLYADSQGSVLGTLQANPDVGDLRSGLGLEGSATDDDLAPTEAILQAGAAAAEEAAATTDAEADVRKAARSAIEDAAAQRGVTLTAREVRLAVTYAVRQATDEPASTTSLSGLDGATVDRTDALRERGLGASPVA